MTSMGHKIICLSLYEKNYSRGSVYLNSSFVIKSNVLFKQIKSGLRNSVSEIRAITKSEKESETIFVICSPSHILVPILRIFWKGKIVLDAGWPLTDAALSREFDRLKLYRLAKSFLIDVLSLNLASRILLESSAQASRVSRKFFIPKQKIHVLLTGFDESSISEGATEIPELSGLDLSKPIVTFRGSVNPESGLDIISLMSCLPGAARFNLLICVNKVLPKMNFSENTRVITRRLTVLELAKIYKISEVFIGQVSENRRLSHTIPHKAFEAGFFKKAYISIDKPAIRELYNFDDSVEYRNRFTREILLESILDLLDNPAKLRTREMLISESYQRLSNQDNLGKKFINLVLES